jgi:hypothetical protein
VHGTFGDRKSLLDNLSLALVQHGYCVYSLDYGNRGTGPIEDPAQQLKDFVDRVLASTGAAKVEVGRAGDRVLDALRAPRPRGRLVAHRLHRLRPPTGGHPAWGRRRGSALPRP